MAAADGFSKVGKSPESRASLCHGAESVDRNSDGTESKWVPWMIYHGVVDVERHIGWRRSVSERLETRPMSASYGRSLARLRSTRPNVVADVCEQGRNQVRLEVLFGKGHEKQ